MPPRIRLLLMDANVLIDYQQSDISVLELVSRHVGPVHVLATVLDEVDGLDAADCERQGPTIVEPDLDHLTRAAVRRGGLSFADHLCLQVAMERHFVCVTNDRALRRACGEEGVAVRWGLELMKDLVRDRAMPAADAIRVARAIHQGNPHHIPEKIVAEFARQVTGIERRRGDG